MDPGTVPNWVGGGFVMEQPEGTSQADIYYRLGQVSEKCASLQTSVHAMEHNSEVLATKISTMDSKVTMLFTGVIIAAFLMPIIIPVAAHFIDAVFSQNNPTSKP